MSDIPTATQIRAALAMIGWENKKLAAAAGLTEVSVSNIKNGTTQPQPKSRDKIRRALEASGIEFLGTDGVRQHSSDVEVFVGPDRFRDFTDFVYEYLVENGGDVCIHAVDETLFRKYRTDVETYRENMLKLVNDGKITVRILAGKSDFSSVFAKMKWQPVESSAPTSFYAFGNCLALISFDHDPAPYVALHKSGPFAEAYRQSFEAAWANAKDPAERPQ